ncbi:MAG TPA: hypothetical protein VKP69_10495 [Isosphaeraceae bacterium]|nr:hypothetical protein [Isosphaeraceae bacterium]
MSLHVVKRVDQLPRVGRRQGRPSGYRGKLSISDWAMARRNSRYHRAFVSNAKQQMQSNAWMRLTSLS